MASAKRDPLPEALRKVALALPGTDEGVACANTALEARTVRAGGKAFLFLGPKELRLKLGASLADAKRLAAKHAGIVKVGKGAWVAVTREGADALPMPVLAAWVKESHALVAPKR